MQPCFDRPLGAAQYFADLLVAQFFLVIHHETRSVVVSKFAESQFQFFADVELILFMF